MGHCLWIHNLELAIRYFDDIVAGLTDWTVPDIRATPDLRAQVQKALDQAYDDYYAGRLPPVPQDASSPP